MTDLVVGAVTVVGAVFAFGSFGVPIKSRRLQDAQASKRAARSTCDGGLAKSGALVLHAKPCCAPMTALASTCECPSSPPAGRSWLFEWLYRNFQTLAAIDLRARVPSGR